MGSPVVLPGLHQPGDPVAAPVAVAAVVVVDLLGPAPLEAAPVAVAVVAVEQVDVGIVS
jgi:hypothetical protein